MSKENIYLLSVALFGAILWPLHTCCRSSHETLNTKVSQTSVSSGPSNLNASTLSANLRKQAMKMKTKFYRPTSSKLDYAALANSVEYKEYLTIADQLSLANLAMLPGKPEKISFWINVYNAMLVHGILHYQVKTSVKDHPDFFSKTAYTIGGHRFSLDEIEHNILRGKGFPKKDVRHGFALSKIDVDPRIHFALNCGSRSCPPIDFYDPETLDRQLEDATKLAILTQTQLKDGRVFTSEIFKWYASDFKPSVRKFLIRYAQEPIKTALENNATIEYSPYDWSLNGL